MEKVKHNKTKKVPKLPHKDELYAKLNEFDLAEIVRELSAEIKNDNQTMQQQHLMKLADLTKELYEHNQIMYEIRRNVLSLSELPTGKQSSDEAQILRDKLTIEKNEKIRYMNLLNESYEKEEKLLRSYSKLVDRYTALKESLLGRLTLKYWSFRKSLKRGS